MNKNIHLITIEGGIGVGKTTFIKEMVNIGLKQDIVVISVVEPVNKWINTPKHGINILESTYHTSKHFEMNQAYIQRTLEDRDNIIIDLLKAYEKLYSIKPELRVVVVCERSITSAIDVFSKKFLDEGKITDYQYKLLQELYENNLLPFESMKVVLHSNNSYERVKMRGRAREDIPKEYLDDIAKRTADVFHAARFISTDIPIAEYEGYINEIFKDLFIDV